MSTRIFNKADAVLTNEEIVFICRALKDDQLKVLSLRACTVRWKDLKRILELAAPCRSLQQLTLNIGMLTTVRHVELLARCLRANSSLTGLHIHGSDLGDMGMKVLGLALSKHPGIVSLDVGDCKLGDMSIDVLYSLLLPLGNKSGLTELTLSNNPHISALGWAQFGMCLANCSCLRWLFLDYNPLGDYGASCVLVALAASQSVQVLDLEGCGLTEHTGQAILHLVQNHLGGLSQVKLSNNRIRTSTVLSIRKHLSDNHFDDSCSLSTLSAEDLFSINDKKMPAQHKTSKYNKSSSSSSSSSSTDSVSDSESSSDDDSKKQSHRIQTTQKHTKMPGKHAQSQAEKQAGKKQKEGLKEKVGKSENIEKEKDKSEKQNDTSEKQKDKIKKPKNKIEKQNDDSKKLKNESEKQKNKKEKQKNKSERQNNQQSTGMEGMCKKEERDNDTYKPKQYSKQSKMAEKKGKQSKPCIKCSRSDEDSDDREANSDKNPSTGDSDSAGDELQEVPVFYK
ncbi:hypothetical protein BsWGS_10588 [Bradybaena similaris]